MGVKDLGQALEWYQSTLGFELIYHMEEMGWAELKSPVDRVNVGLSQVEDHKPEGGATLTFGVKNIDRARATLEEQKVRFDGETLTYPEMVRLATFFDPDGNKLMLYQSLQSA